MAGGSVDFLPPLQSGLRGTGAVKEGWPGPQMSPATTPKSYPKAKGGIGPNMTVEIKESEK